MTRYVEVPFFELNLLEFVTVIPIERGLLFLILRCLYLLAETFYYVEYGSSIITSKIPSKILSNENKKTGVSRKIVCFGVLIHVLSWRQQKRQCLCFHYWYLLTNIWRNNWWSIFDIVERLCYWQLDELDVMEMIFTWIYLLT